MKIKFIHPETNEEVILESDDIDIGKLNNDFKLIIPKDKVLNFIENLSIPAEAKLILAKVADFSMSVGNYMLNIGRKILEMVFYTIKKYPNTSIGGVVGAVLGITLGSIPLIGAALGFLLQPLLVALGLTFGFWEDVQHKIIRKHTQADINELFKQFKNFRTV